MNEKTNKETRQTSLHDDNVKLSLSVKDVTNKRNVFLFLNFDMGLKNSSLQLGYIYHVERVGIILMRFVKNTSSLSL